MGLQFEGALDNISEPQLAFIRDVLEKRGFKDTKVTVENVGKAGDNYSATVKRIIARNENGEFRMIAKPAPSGDFIRTQGQTEKVFKNEHTMYTMVLPKFQQIEKQADVPEEERLRFAECYGSSLNAPNEIILLEDLQVPGFAILDRFKPIPDECMRSVLKNFAILHSLSYALKHKDMETYNLFTSNLCDLWAGLFNNSMSLPFFEKIENTAMNVVDGDDKKRLVKGCMATSGMLAAKMAKQDTGIRRSVILQGDSWTNNFMFKFDGDALQQSIMIDYQQSKESSPVSDLLYCILNCSDHKSRCLHFEEWIDYYHTELDKSLSNYGLKANHIFPRDQLDADLKRYGKLMLGVTLLIASVIINSVENAELIKESMDNLDKLEELLMKKDLEEEYLIAFKKRVEGIIDTLIKFGLV